ncbi:MAG: hypothetical protein ABIZ81_11385 [Opitutaceae bacterium]
MSKSDFPVEKVLEKTIFASRWLQALRFTANERRSGLAKEAKETK